jgi:hypothetical protein
MEEAQKRPLPGAVGVEIQPVGQNWRSDPQWSRAVAPGWAGAIGDADSRGDWPSGAGHKTRTASGDPEVPTKVAVMDTRSGRSGGPLECTSYRLWAAAY